MQDAAPKHYSRSEERWNAATHLAGAVLAAAGGIWLLGRAPAENAGLRRGMAIYVLTLLAMFTASSVYHLATRPETKALCRRFDHGAIYLLIVGTYTPLLWGGFAGPHGRWILPVMWAVALLGTGLKVAFGSRFHRLHVIFYLLLGWSVVLYIRPVVANVSAAAIILLAAGGVVYSAGVALYAAKFPGAHALWHLCVLFGAFLQLAALGNL